jgi:hypothetical protein
LRDEQPLSCELNQPENIKLAITDVTARKAPSRATPSKAGKILVSRNEAAEMLSISCRALDYLLASKQIIIRRIGARVLIPISDLERYSGSDHPERLAG